MQKPRILESERCLVGEETSSYKLIRDFENKLFLKQLNTKFHTFKLTNIFLFKIAEPPASVEASR